MTRLKLLVPLLVCFILGTFFYLFLSMGKDPNAMPSALIGKHVPAFSLPTLGKGQADLGKTANEQVFKGSPALLNVWATWCAPCRVEHPFLNQLAGQGIKIIGVNYKDEPGNAQSWLDNKGDPYYISVIDFYGRLGIDLGVFGAPETYLVDANGIIRHKHIGVLNQEVWDKDFMPLLRKLGGSH